MILIADIQYFPSITYYINLSKGTNIIINAYDPYQKMSFFNRTLIAGANGVITLSVPLSKGRHQKGPMKDIRIDQKEAWQISHWKTLLSCYNRSPWFDYFRDDLFRLYAKPFQFLLDWDLACFNWSTDQLGLQFSILIEDLNPLENRSIGQVDLRGLITPRNYKEYSPLVYKQVFEQSLGFLPNLSILDLLFCEGKKARNLLMQNGAPGSMDLGDDRRRQPP
jgi:hypothetical protein